MKEKVPEAGKTVPVQRGSLWLATFMLLSGLIIGWLVHDRYRNSPPQPPQPEPVLAQLPAQPASHRQEPLEIPQPQPVETQSTPKLARPSVEATVAEPVPQFDTAPPPVAAPVANESRNAQPASTRGSLAGTTPSGGSVAGHVYLDGTPPPEIVIMMDPRSRALQTNTPTTRFFVTSTNGGLGDVVVYLEGRLPPFRSARDLPPLIIDHHRSFKVPYISAAVVGQTIILTNSDPLMHDCHITPKPRSRNREMNYSLFPGHNVCRFSFSAPEDFIRMKCDVHPWEMAYVSVFPHRFFAVTDDHGRFAITNVPPGRYRVHARHRHSESTGSVEVEVREGKASQADLRLVVAN